MNYRKITKILSNLKGECRQQYKAEIKGIFGSYARGEATENSDVDILVEFSKGATLLDLAGLGNFLEEKLERKVDVVSQRAIRKEIRHSIYKDMVFL